MPLEAPRRLVEALLTPKVRNDMDRIKQIIKNRTDILIGVAIILIADYFSDFDPELLDAVIAMFS